MVKAMQRTEDSSASRYCFISCTTNNNNNIKDIKDINNKNCSSRCGGSSTNPSRRHRNRNTNTNSRHLSERVHFLMVVLVVLVVVLQLALVSSSSSSLSSSSSSAAFLTPALNHAGRNGNNGNNAKTIIHKLPLFGVKDHGIGNEIGSGIGARIGTGHKRYTTLNANSMDKSDNAAPSFELNIDDEIDQIDSSSSSTSSTSTSSSTSFNSSNEINIGEWEYLHGNYLLRPPQTSPYATEPRALLHFLGGAIVGAAPDISYRYILEKLSSSGFLIVSTPFTLSFDYITTCDDIITKFERIAPNLAQQYGPIPVVGVGHSCGSLLHVLITTLFPDTPRAGNVLMSYNNMNVKDAVPLFEEVVVPLFIQLNSNGTGMMLEPFLGVDYPSSSTEVLNLSIDLGRNLVQGTIPSDEAITNIIQKTTPKPFSSIVPKDISIPTPIRNSIESNLLNPLNRAKSDAGITPLLLQSLDVLEQIPSLIEEVANGAKDFNPSPSSVRAAARRAYRARKTLLVQYDDDPIDESEEIESLLKEAGETVMKNKRPMVDFDVQRVVLKGGHATPCLAPPLDLATQVENLVGERTAKDKLLYKGADETVDEIVKWLEEGNL